MAKPVVNPKIRFVVEHNDQKMRTGLSKLVGAKLLVGFPQSTAGRQEMEYETTVVRGRKRKGWAPKGKSEMTNAALAYIHDNGSPIKGIPKREFLRPGIKDAEEAVVGYLGKAAKASLDGDEGMMMAALNSAGIKAVSGVKNKINRGPFQPLAKSTLAARKRRGFKGTKPLTVTGQLRNAVTYVIVQEGKPRKKTEEEEPEEKPKTEVDEMQGAEGAEVEAAEAAEAAALL